MALDKQRILSELGSVVNQLQSADCGCMGKLFASSNGGQGGALIGSPQQGCMGGCCHGCNGCKSGHGHAFSTPCAGEPFSMNGRCMGQCNPPKLYADTYNYLNKNLMQPVVSEVYNDLKTITPDNTVMNSPIAAQMGLPQQGRTPVQGDMAMQQNQMMTSGMGNQLQGNMKMPQNQMLGGGMSGYQMQDNKGMSQYQMQDSMEGNKGMSQGQMQGSRIDNQGMSFNNNQMMSSEMTNQNAMQMMGGMGPQIMGMMKSGGNGRPVSSTPQTGQLKEPMVIDAPGSPHGQVGVTPLSVSGGMAGHFDGGINHGQYTTDGGMTQGQYGVNAGVIHGQHAAAMNQDQYGTNSAIPTEMAANQRMPTTQYMTHLNMASGFNAESQNSVNNNMQGQGNRGTYSNPVAHQMASANRNYGQHTQGMPKFKEMFPGVQGMGGDLGFDPMAIAIQMNPANHQKAAMEKMQKLMTGSAISSRLDTSANNRHMKPAIAGANAAAASIGQANTGNQNIPPSSNQQVYYAQQVSVPVPNAQNLQQGGPANALMTPGQPAPQQQLYSDNQVLQQQPVYTAVTGAPPMNQGQAQQQMQGQQQMIDPNTGAQVQSNPPPTNQGESRDVNTTLEEQSPTSPVEAQYFVKDPIFPVDTSRFQPPPSMRRPKYYHYNTLGQPVEMLPAELYHPPEPNLPQTLSPQPVTKVRSDIDRYHVKSTVSKTALMGNKPVGRTPSRSQLQHIYNQYKGSHSYTQQNIRNPDQNGTHSDRKLNVPQHNVAQVRPVPVEKVGGDTAANNKLVNNQVPVKEQPANHNMGDVLLPNKPQGDSIPKKEESPQLQSRGRNGLQDMIFTSYPTSAAWSFHGKDRETCLTTYRFRNRY